MKRFLFGGRPREDWLREYGEAHRHPVNRFCHTVGIPFVALGLIGLLASPFWDELRLMSLSLFVVGWVFQFVGHAFERKPPEFFKDWRFLLVGLSWWWAKVRGRA